VRWVWPHGCWGCHAESALQTQWVQCREAAAIWQTSSAEPCTVLTVWCLLLVLSEVEQCSALGGGGVLQQQLPDTTAAAS
jgi:hypothetical protein